MNKYRKFRLVNGNGDIYELTSKNHKVFANNPRGLGYSKTISSLRLGDESFIYYSLINLDDISLELLFYDDKINEKYEKYVQFINFVSFKPLYLLYQRPNSFTWYRRRIEIGSLNKTEVSFEDGMLHCEMILKTLSFWEDDDSNIIQTNNQQLEGGKVYPITYPINYGQDSVTNINLNALGLLDAPLEITIDGQITNPEWVIYDENDVVYGRAKFIGTFDKVYVNSKESEENIELTRGGLLLSNPLGYQDLTVGSPQEIYVTFLKLKAGSSKITFFVDDTFNGSVKIEWRNRYVSV